MEPCSALCSSHRRLHHYLVVYCCFPPTRKWSLQHQDVFGPRTEYVFCIYCGLEGLLGGCRLFNILSHCTVEMATVPQSCFSDKGERSGNEAESRSLSLLEAGVSVYCFLTPDSKRRFMGLDTVSPPRRQVLFQSCPWHKEPWSLSKGIMFSFGTNSCPETWINFYTGIAQSWQSSLTWKEADHSKLEESLTFFF